MTVREKILQWINSPRHMLLFSVTCFAISGASLYFGDHSSNPPLLLHVAARHDWPRVAKFLLALNSDVDVADSEGLTALMIAAYLGHRDTMQQLVNYSADLNRRTVSNITALLAAIIGDQPTAARDLLVAGANVSASNQVGTLLHYAVHLNRTALLPLLVAHGVDVDARNPSANLTAVQTALFQKNNDAVQSLVNAGAYRVASAAHSSPAVKTAVALDNMEAVRILLGAECQRDFPDLNGFKAWHLAVGMRDEPLARLLVDLGCNAAVRTDDGVTPLLLATEFGLSGLVRLMLGAGKPANPNETFEGWTVLHQAVHKGHVDIVRLLLAAGADPNAKYQGGTRPIHLVAQEGTLEVAALLIQYGADVGAVTDSGINAQVLAFWHKHHQLAWLLGVPVLVAEPVEEVKMTTVDIPAVPTASM